jgi:hypothetical protein
MSSSIVTRKDRVATLSRVIEEKWEEYWWKNMERLIVELEISDDECRKLSYSPHITQKRIEESNLVDKFYLDFDNLYLSHVIDREFIKKHGIVVAVDTASYDNLTFDNMATVLPDFHTWHPSDVTGVMPIVEIEAHIEDYPWAWRVLSTKRDVTLDFVVKWFSNHGVEMDSRYINASLKDIKKHEDYWLKHIDWKSYVEWNTSMTREIVHAYFEIICKNLESNRQFNSGFMQHLTFEMYLYYIGLTDNFAAPAIITTEIITSALLHGDRFLSFQSNGDVNLSIAEKYPEVAWNMYGLANNPSNTVEIYKKYAEHVMPVHIRRIAGNLTFDYLIEHKDDIKTLRVHPYTTPNKLLCEEYTYEEKSFKERKYREHMAAYCIQQWWLRVTSDPSNPVCRRRLEREYAEMFQVTPN